ncbi:hypothetical protein CCACVL1_03759 [Corchorus capsularis]|uniref:Uncharacterized protein n=1 Tax=Corchorus capsularis TaxID=210143 RepID=A0A1R3JXD1_COCAP|nr:hypothetical protein CCACVL1_03759 [Corchorus capsularis]
MATTRWRDTVKRGEARKTRSCFAILSLYFNPEAATTRAQG